MEPLHHPGKGKDRHGPEGEQQDMLRPDISDLNWDTLETRRAKSQVTMMFKIIHGLVDIPAADLATSLNQNKITPWQEAETICFLYGHHKVQLLPLHHSIVELPPNYLSHVS